MRCRKTFAVLLAALLLITFVVPAYGHNGLLPGWMKEKIGNHPWQDDNSHTGPIGMYKTVTFVVGPFVISFNLPITKGDKDILHKNPLTKKPQGEPSNPQKGE